MDISEGWVLLIVIVSLCGKNLKQQEKFSWLKKVAMKMKDTYASRVVFLILIVSVPCRRRAKNLRTTRKSLASYNKK